MFLYTTRFRKRPFILCALLLALAVGGLFLWTSSTPDPVTTVDTVLDSNQARIDFLSELGWQVNSEPLETLQFLLPNPLTLAYLTYNELQLAQGYDLTPYAGQAVTRYTYQVENYPNRTSGVQLNLYLHQNIPIAGDVICPGADGFQASLVFPISNDGA